MKREIITIIICWLSFWALPAHAELITIQITGQVDSIYDPYGYFKGKIKVGDLVEGTYVYQSSTPDSDLSDPIKGTYYHYIPPAGISLSAGSVQFASDPFNLAFEVFTRNNIDSGDDIYGFISHRNLSLSGNVYVETISWQLNDSTGTAFSTDALPLTAPVLENWDWNSLHIDTLRAFGISGHVTAATVIPEPGTFLIIGFGALILKHKTLIKKINP